MFVQTHFQRTRHQAASTNSSAHHSHNHSQHNHNQRHHQHSSSHSSVSHQQQQQQQHYFHSVKSSSHNQREHGAHADHESAPVHARREADAPAVPRASTIKSEQKRIKRETCAHQSQAINDSDLKQVHHRATAAAHLSQSGQSGLVVNERQRDCTSSRATDHRRHSCLRRSSEFEEAPEDVIRGFHEGSYGKLERDVVVLRENGPPTVDYQQHTGMLSVSNDTQNSASLLTLQETSLASQVPSKTSTSTTRTTTTTLRLRATSLSSPVNLNTADDATCGGSIARSSSGSSSGPRPHRAKVRPRIRRGRHAFRWSLARKSQLKARRNKNHPVGNSFGQRLGRILEELLGPHISVSHTPPSKKNILSKRKSAEKPEAFSFLNLLLLTSSIKQTLHCFALFLLNFLHYQWLIFLGHFLVSEKKHLELETFIERSTRSSGVENSDAYHIYERHTDAAAPKSSEKINCSTSDHMRTAAMRNQRPMTLGGLNQVGARSFDADRGEYAHEIFGALPHSATHRHHYADQLQFQSQAAAAAYLEPGRQRAPVASQNSLPPWLARVGGHVHQHNHATSPAPCFGAHAICPHLAQLQARTETFINHNFDASLASNPSNHHLFDAQTLANDQPSGYATDRSLARPAPQFYVGPEPALVRVGSQAPVDASHAWRWHTFDGWPSESDWLGAAEAVHAPARPQATSFDHNTLRYSELQPQLVPGAQTGGGHSRGLGMPPRQHVTSISSPTLSEHENTRNYWEPSQTGDWSLPPPTRAGVHAGHHKVAPAHYDPHHFQALQQASHQSQPAYYAHHRPLTYDGRPDLLVAGVQGPMPHRRLSSIMGSDSELYTVKRELPSSHLLPKRDQSTSDDIKSDLAGPDSKVAPTTFQQSKQNAIQNSRPTVAEERDTKVALGSERRRLIRQSRQSSATPKSYRAAAAAAAADESAHLPKLTRQCLSLQVDPVRAEKTVSDFKDRRQSKSDSETRPARKADSARPLATRGGTKTTTSASSGASETGTGSKSASPSERRGALIASGKSKSVVGRSAQEHASGIGVLGRAVSLAGAKRRLGFKQKGGLNSLSVHRSEEIFPLSAVGDQQQSLYVRRRFRAQASSVTTASNSLNSDCSYDAPGEMEPGGGSPWLRQFGVDAPNPRACFVEGLGVGQIASRQALVSPYLGDIQVSLSDRRGMLEVEIIRVRNLQLKAGAKCLPSPYVKVYLMRNKKCAAKFKTSHARQTLDPLYQQLFIFRDDYSNCVLQIIVWADYGKKDRKSLMGIVQIHLDQLDMSSVVISWYKLFNVSSMVATTASAPGVASSSKALRQTLSSTKLGDWATTTSATTTTTTTSAITTTTAATATTNSTAVKVA